MTVIAVTDQEEVLGVFRKPGTPANVIGNFGRTAADLAVSLARTGAFFSNDQAPLSSRTVRFISGIHFPPGFNYVVAPDVRGKVTVRTIGQLHRDKMFGVLLAVLEAHGFTAARAGDLYKIVRTKTARERAVPTIIESSSDASRMGDEIITQIVPLRFAGVEDLLTLLPPSVSTCGSLIAHRDERRDH